MIYINENTINLEVPKHIYAKPADTISFTNQLTHQNIVAEVEDSTQNKPYFTFDISDLISNFQVGHYDYSVLSENEEIGSGICQYGDFNHTPSAYTVDVNIKQYNG